MGPDARDEIPDGWDGSFDWDAQGGARVEAGNCAVLYYYDPAWVILGSYPDLGLSYDGPAQVMAGFQGIMLALTAGKTVPSGAPPYIEVQGAPGPQLPAGANVWVTLEYEDQPASNPCAPYPFPPGSCPVAIGWSFSVSDRQHGTVLFGQTHQDPDERFGLIYPRQIFPYCSNEYVTFYAVDVPGAVPNPLPTGAGATVAIAGVEYQIWVGASSMRPPPAGERVTPAKHVNINFEAKDLARRAAALVP
jgi:hypothetical protein